MSSRPYTCGYALYGLVLAGGRSTPHGARQGALDYARRHRSSSAPWSSSAPLVSARSCRCAPSSAGDPQRARYPQIADLADGPRPARRASWPPSAHPEAAWLVLACDLPLPRCSDTAAPDATARSDALATAYRTSHDGLPEPLCAIYEPAQPRTLLRRRSPPGMNCPRNLLRQCRHAAARSAQSARPRQRQHGRRVCRRHASTLRAPNASAARSA